MASEALDRLEKARLEHGRIEEHFYQVLVAEVARFHQQGMRTTELVLHYRRSSAMVCRWLREAERKGLIPRRRPGRPRKAPKEHKIEENNTK